MTPTPIEWHSREVAMTWPEGSVVIVKLFIDDDGQQWTQRHVHNYWRSEFAETWLGTTVQFALLELPRKEVTFTQ